MLSTTHQRNILEIFQKEKCISLDILKEKFVDTKTMNMTTLYRILDRWKSEKMLYEIEIDKKRMFLFCGHHHENEGIKISFCTNCENAEESHFPLPENAMKAESVEYLKTCPCCSK